MKIIIVSSCVVFKPPNSTLSLTTDVILSWNSEVVLCAVCRVLGGLIYNIQCTAGNKL